MESLSVFTALPNIPAQAWVWPFASELLNEAEGGFGLNRNPDGVQRFTLPLRAEDSSGAGPNRRSNLILLIEDNAGDAGLVREALVEYAVEAELVVIPDGDQAIRFVDTLDAGSSCCPDLIIVDLSLPKRPGREVLKRMRQSEKCRNATVVILSSSDAAQDKADALRLGASQYIRKPLLLREFLALGAVFKKLLSRE